MRRIIIIFFLLSGAMNSIAQDTGMQFEHNTSWQNILTKAKTNDKYIFVDCYATWCGPCKMMAAKVFPTHEAGAFYNAEYINVKAQMDTSAADNEDAKARYADNHVLLTKYEITVYPTYLIFNPDGELVQRFVGSMPADEFVSRGKSALLPENQYYTQLRKFQDGDRSAEFLRRLATMSLNAQDMKTGRIVLNEYLKTQSDLYTQENLDLILPFTRSSQDRGFELMMENPAKVDLVLGKNTSSEKIILIILREELSPKIFAEAVDTLVARPDWNSLEIEISKKYPAYSKEVISIAKVYFYQYNKQWKQYGSAVAAYMDDYGNKLRYEQVNEFAWNIFENCDDAIVIKKALDWSRKSFETKNDPAYIDTYAHLLLKSGRKPEAIEWESKALAIAKEKNFRDVEVYEKALAEMRAK